MNDYPASCASPHFKNTGTTITTINVLQVIAGLPGEFTNHQIEQGLQYRFPKSYRAVRGNPLNFRLRFFRQKGWITNSRHCAGAGTASRHIKTDQFPDVEQLKVRPIKKKRRGYNPPAPTGLAALWFESHLGDRQPAAEIVFGLGREDVELEERI
jgi:hypothetical protein